jgi:hypothetical protein
VTGHASGPEELIERIDAGMNAVEHIGAVAHGPQVPREVISALLARRVHVVPWKDARSDARGHQHCRAVRLEHALMGESLGAVERTESATGEEARIADPPGHR